MGFDWTTVVPNLISAGTALAGVALGGWQTLRLEAKREKDKTKKESDYLAILVVAHLDRFVDGCLQVACDDGTYMGRPAGDDGCCETTTREPEFDPLALKVDWKVLPADLMYGILNLPYKAEQLANYVLSVREYDFPPGYGDTFWARQHGYAVLGLEVSELASRLRKHSSLPDEATGVGGWNRCEQLRTRRDDLIKAKEGADAKRAAVQ